MHHRRHFERPSRKRRPVRREKAAERRDDDGAREPNKIILGANTRIGLCDVGDRDLPSATGIIQARSDHTLSHGEVTAPR